MTSRTESHVRSVLERLVCQRLAIPPEQLTPEASFIGDLGADSLDMVDLILELETELQLRIAESELSKMSTVGAALSYLCERIEGESPQVLQDAAEVSQ
jgi:acyl carrier protein